MFIMRCLIISCLTFTSILCASVSPIYSHAYSKVLYQGVAGSSQQTEKDKIQSGISDEDVTILDVIEPTPNNLLPNDITPEPESEQVDFIFFPRENANIELLDEDENDGEKDFNEETSTEFEEVDQKRHGMYYIFHPNGILQKVVYGRRRNEEANFAQIEYQGAVPIIEPVYTYDPSTFVLQRLQIFTG